MRRALPDADREELERVDELAQLLRAHLEQCEAEIAAVHVHGAKSSAVQAIVSRLLRSELEFREEERLSGEIALTTRSRPDFVYRLGPGRGILAEVERGGTTTNNHDLKDFWKTHIASDAQHLFLVVPMSNWKKGGKARERPFNLVSRRLQAFFGDERREVDVVSAHVFGYGAVELEPGEVE